MKKIIFRKAKWQLLLAFCLVFIASLVSKKTYAQSISPTVLTTYAAAPGGPDPGYSWTLRIAGKRKSSAGEITKWVMNEDQTWATLRHCDNQFLFVAYVGDTITLDIKWNLDAFDRLPCSYPEKFYFQLVQHGFTHISTSPYLDSVQENGAITFIVPPTGAGGTSPFGYIKAWFKNSCNGATIEARILVIDKPTKMTYEPSEICANSISSGTDYTFKIVTEPKIKNLMGGDDPLSHGVWSGGSCESASDANFNLKFEMQYPDPISTPVRNQLDVSNLFLNNFFFGAARNLWPWAGTTGNLEEYYFKNSEMTTFLTSTNNPVLGKAIYDDGYATTLSSNIFMPVKAEPTVINYNNVSAYLILEYNKNNPSTISGHTAEPYGTIDAPDHETWTPTNNPMVNEGYGDNVPILQIKDKIVIGKGQSLTIKDMTVEMGKDAQIIVESDPAGLVEAGRLILDNATIKAFRDCGHEGNLWNGIVLKGNSSKPQAAIGGDFAKRYQAMLYMTNNASVQEATIAVRTYDPSTTGRTGGLVYAYNSSFKNNLLSIDIAPFGGWTVGKEYLNNYSNCSFVADDESIKTSFEGFIRTNTVQGLQIKSCSFETKYGTAMVGYGIKGNNTGLVVRGTIGAAGKCYFKGLQDAILISKSAFSAAANLNINYSNFVQNYTAVHTKGVMNPTIAQNTIQIPDRPTPSYLGRNCTGYNIETGSGYDVSSNSFSRVLASSSPTPSAGNNAVLVWNSGSAPNEVKGNTVSNLNQGMISNFKNTNSSFLTPFGLQFLCNNQSLNVGTCLAALGADPSQDGMRAEQGSNSRAAGNGFAHLYYDIYNPSTEVGAVNYFYNSAPNANPTMNVGSVFTNLTSASDGCTTLPTKTYPPTLIATTGYTGAALREVIRNNIDYYAEHYELATRSSELHAALDSLADAYSDLARVDLYIEDHDTEAANSLYNGIVASRGLIGKEALEFSHWGRQLLDMSIALQAANAEPTQLSTAQVATLAGIADSAQMWAKVRAQNWLQSYDGRSYVNTFMYPPITSGGNQRKVLDNTITGGDALQNAVFPNPAKGYIDVVYRYQNEKANTVVLELRDMMGRIVLTENINNTTEQRVNIEKLPTSVYLYRIIEDGEVKAEGKLTKQ